MLKTENLTKKFENLVAVDGINLEIGKEPGELTFIVGPNGAGKSTFINLLTGHLYPSEGSIHMNGEDITNASPVNRIQSGLGRSFQIVHIFDEMTVRENLRTVLLSREGQTHRVFTTENSFGEIEEEIKKILNQFKLVEKADMVAMNLSHGDRKLLDVALSFALEPDYLLLDEPTSGVGTNQKSDLIETVVRASKEQEISTIMIEHDMDIVTNYANRVIALHEGQVLADGNPEILERDDELRNILLGVKND